MTPQYNAGGVASVRAAIVACFDCRTHDRALNMPYYDDVEIEHRQIAHIAS